MIVPVTDSCVLLLLVFLVIVILRALATVLVIVHCMAIVIDIVYLLLSLFIVIVNGITVAYGFWFCAYVRV